MFNENKSLNRGGRAVGIWLQRAPKRLQNLISINGHKCINLDISGCHLALIAAKENVDVDWEHDDIYDMGIESLRKHRTREGGKNEVVYDHEIIRDNIKTIILAALNAPTYKLYVGAVVDNGLYIKEANEVIDRFTQRNPWVNNYIYSGIGLELQYYESEYLHRLMVELMIKRNIYLIPMFDGLVVVNHQDVYKIMIQLWSDMFNSKIYIKEKKYGI